MSRYRSSRDYRPPTDNDYIHHMHRIVTAQPFGGPFAEPVQILPHLYLGSQVHAESLKTLRRLNITHVLNCAGFKGPRQFPDANPYEGFAIGYLEFKADDDDAYDITQHFNTAFGFLNNVFRDSGRALVHCAMGINRSVAICIAYLMVYLNMPLLKATEYVKERRRLCLSNEGFRAQLVQFAKGRNLLGRLPRRRVDPYEEHELAMQRRREESDLLPRNMEIKKVLSKDYFKQSDSLLDSGLMFRYERFMNRDKV